MKRNLKDIKFVCIGLLIGVLITSTTTVIADSIQQKIDVIINNVNIKINDNILTTQNKNYVLANGQEVPYSILYKGTTYLPMRVVAESIGKDVSWDNTTLTASINDKERDNVSEVGKVDNLNVNINTIENFMNLFSLNTDYTTITVGKDKYSAMQFNYEGDLSSEEIIVLIDNDTLKDVIKNYMIEKHTEYGRFNIKLYNNTTKELISYGYTLMKMNNNGEVSYTFRVNNLNR